MENFIAYLTHRLVGIKKGGKQDESICENGEEHDDDVLLLR